MPVFVLFTLYAPLGAWGSPSRSSATTAVRPTDLVPTRSAVIGLLGAALGLERRHLPSLAAAVLIATREEVRPRPQPRADFHTLTPPRPPTGTARWTRFEEIREAMSGRGGGAMLSWREFFENGLWTVAVLPTTPSCPAPDRLAAALNAPVFPLFAGRKAFPLGVPPDAQPVEAEDLCAAFSRYEPRWRDLPALSPLRRTANRPAQAVLRLDEDLKPLLPQGSIFRAVRRWDMTVHHPDEAKAARRFSPRVELEWLPDQGTTKCENGGERCSKAV